MKRLLITCCIGLLCQVAYSQDSSLNKNYVIKTRVWETNQTTRFAYLVNVTDSLLQLADAPVPFRQSLLNPTLLNYQQIDMITLQRKGSVGRGLWKGALGGMVLGGIVGAVTYKKCDDCFWDFGIGTDIAAGAIVGTGSGALVGAIVGALARKKFIISGNKNKFDEMRLSVLDMTYRKGN